MSSYKPNPNQNSSEPLIHVFLMLFSVELLERKKQLYYLLIIMGMYISIYVVKIERYTIETILYHILYYKVK